MPDTTSEHRANLVRRLPGALRRRARYAISRLTRGRQRPPVEAAVDWLIRLDRGHGLPATLAEPVACPALTGASIETALSLGHRESALRWAGWLMSIQRADGSISNSNSGDPSLADTSQAVRGFLAIVNRMPEVENATCRACEYLCSQLDDDGRIRPSCHKDGSGRDSPDCDEFPLVWPLLHAGTRLSVADWVEAARRAVDYWATRADARSCISSVGPITRHVEYYLRHGRDSAAAELARRLDPAQRRIGSLREGLNSGPILSASLARAALLWYRLRCRERADRALQYLEKKQGRGGGFRSGWGWSLSADLPRNDPWAVKYYLDAALLRVHAAFETQWPLFPDRIDPSDGRMQAVRDWFGALSSHARVADVGCGKGRFLRHLLEWFPRARLTGIDVSSAMLNNLPTGVLACEGSLLDIPATDGAFDGVFAVESLEHSLIPERAIAELCRVVRPGGQVLIIDKHRGKQPLSEHDPWERWFLPEELSSWLSGYCEQVTVKPIPHGEGGGGSELFLAARGTRLGGDS